MAERSKKSRQLQAERLIPFTPFEDYKDKYAKFLKLDRSPSGVLTAQWHNNGGSDNWDVHLHRGIHQFCSDVGQDLDTEVLIIGGTGDKFLDFTTNSLGDEKANFHWLSYDYMFYDGCNMIEGLINDVEVPTIGVINGWCCHAEIALFCDYTIMAEDAVIFEPHFSGGMYPGDGVQIALRHYMGPKRANRAMLTNEVITAQKALEYGLVSEVVPREKLYERAQELGEELAKQPRVMRRMMSHLMRYTLKQEIAQELRYGFGTEMWIDFVNHKEMAESTHEEGWKTLEDRSKLKDE